MFPPALSGPLEAMGCHEMPGQEYKLRHAKAEFQFEARLCSFDKGYAKLLIIQFFHAMDYHVVTFVTTPLDRQLTLASTTHVYFSAKVEM